MSSSGPKPSSPAPVRGMAAADQGLVARYIVAPLIFITFILSLSLIDQRNTSFRTRSHSTSIPSFLPAPLQHFFYKPCPSPYSDVRPPGSPRQHLNDREQEGWHWHTKQGKMLRKEVVDAFELRKWVVVALAVLGAALAYTVWWAAEWVWGWCGVWAVRK